MSLWAVRASTPRAEPRRLGDRDQARLLTLLEADRTGALTTAALRERGFEAPAQMVYELQLAGYEIDRVPCEHPDGRRILGYRLRGSSAPVPYPSARLKEVRSDEA
jgi:hypothetical protein